MRKIDIITQDGFHYCSVNTDNKLYRRETNDYLITDEWSRDLVCKKVDHRTYQIQSEKNQYVNH